jgi:transcription antitermination factor NusG
VAWAIRYNNKPAILQDKEYELINRFLDTGLTIEITSAEDFHSGDRVTVRDGALKGAVGQVTQLHPGKFTVLLEAIGQLLRVDLDPGLLKKLS